jgi:hypothetical protein
VLLIGGIDDVGAINRLTSRVEAADANIIPLPIVAVKLQKRLATA